MKSRRQAPARRGAGGNPPRAAALAGPVCARGRRAAAGQRLTVVLIVAVQAILVGLKVQVTQTSKQILPTPKGPLKQVR